MKGNHVGLDYELDVGETRKNRKRARNNKESDEEESELQRATRLWEEEGNLDAERGENKKQPDLQELQEEIKQLKQQIKRKDELTTEWRDYVVKYIRGGEPFFYKTQIKEMMLEQNSSDKWKSKEIREVMTDLTMVQNKLNTRRRFGAADETHGLIQVCGVARDITSVFPYAITWVKKAVDDTLEIALREGREYRRQGIFRNCMVKQLINQVAEMERQMGKNQPPFSEGASSYMKY